MDLKIDNMQISNTWTLVDMATPNMSSVCAKNSGIMLKMHVKQKEVKSVIPLKQIDSIMICNSFKIHLILVSGHLAITETQAETDALEALLDQAPKYTQKDNIFIGGKSGKIADPSIHCQ